MQFGWVSIQSARAEEEAAKRRRQRREESEASDGDGMALGAEGREGADDSIAETREAQETRMLVRLGSLSGAFHVPGLTIYLINLCIQELYGEAVQAQEEGRYELAKHRYRQILEGPFLQHHLQHRAACGSSARGQDPASVGTGALAGDELLEKMRYLAIKNTGEVLRLEGKEREAGEALAAATGACVSKWSITAAWV